ncbi:hypothetical protein CABS01_08255 [Colletotrichum abscissum]|nr:uncharacterized protein CCOS01_15316 [Colletotrichum costaricense]XP_060402421.1 uncharacterized protein CABS01_08255 [Colletotrichum abscissum]KAK1509025.1 hypothetical protein CABS01_08255 [Colletotrichum abscissum]KAK1510485.1 hypothetical protein CCOS01_15316 [Colletotrichum costaricense]
MSSVPLSTTDAVFSHQHRLPRYSVGARKTTPTSISYTATTRTIPQNIKLMDMSKYTQLAEDYKEKVLGSGINQHLVAEGGSVLQRNAEQDNVVLFHTHIAHPTLECLAHIIESDTHDVKCTWEHQLRLPSIPKPQPDPAIAAASGKAKSDANKATTSNRSTRPTKRRRMSSLPSVRVSPISRSHVEVRPDMIVVLDPADARKIDLKHASLEAKSVCLTCVEMKRTGILASRVKNIKAAAAPLPLPVAVHNRMRARGSQVNTPEAIKLDVGSSNLSKQGIGYCLTHRVRDIVLSEFGISFFLRFPNMPLDLPIRELWEHGVGDVMEVGILEEGDSEKMRAAFLGANIEALKDLQETGRFNVGL